MSTRVYGKDFDIAKFEGELEGMFHSTESGILIAVSDGTILTLHYGKPGLDGVWTLTVLRKGDLFDRLEVCTDSSAGIYSDVAHFKDGPLKAWAANEPEQVS